MQIVTIQSRNRDSESGQGEYQVRPDPQTPKCTCPDYEYRNARCKHIVAVEYVLMRETTPDGATVVTETVKVTRKTYTQDWKATTAFSSISNRKR